MKWIFEHLQLIIVVAGAIAYWLNQRAREKAGQEADYDEDGVPENRPSPRAETRELSTRNREGTDFDQEERARRIREEIQRKIAERRGQSAPPPPMPEPPRLDPFRPVFQEKPAPASPPPLRPPEPASPREVVASAYDDSAAIERQRRLAEQLEELEERRRAARREAASVRTPEPSRAATTSAGTGATLGGRAIATELRDPRALRRAIVLREVLSAPVALR